MTERTRWPPPTVHCAFFSESWLLAPVDLGWCGYLDSSICLPMQLGEECRLHCSRFCNPDIVGVVQFCAGDNVVQVERDAFLSGAILQVREGGTNAKLLAVSGTVLRHN